MCLNLTGVYIGTHYYRLLRNKPIPQYPPDPMDAFHA